MIVSRKLDANSKNLIGVNIMANLETQESVPYLTHLDFGRSIKELTEFCDFVVLNLSEDLETSGIK